MRHLLASESFTHDDDDEGDDDDDDDVDDDEKVIMMMTIKGDYNEKHHNPHKNDPDAMATTLE